MILFARSSSTYFLPILLVFTLLDMRPIPSAVGAVSSSPSIRRLPPSLRDVRKSICALCSCLSLDFVDMRSCSLSLYLGATFLHNMQHNS